MNVSLTPELEDFILGKVDSGLYSSASEVVREALRLLQERDRLYKAKLEDLRADLDIGAEELAAGKAELIDRKALEQLKAEARRRAAKTKRKKKRA